MLQDDVNSVAIPVKRQLVEARDLGCMGLAHDLFMDDDDNSTLTDHEQTILERGVIAGLAWAIARGQDPYLTRGDVYTRAAQATEQCTEQWFRYHRPAQALED